MHHAGQVLEVDLVDNAAAGRHDPEVLEGSLRPAQQGVALHVALVLAIDVQCEGVGAAEVVDLYGVVDHQVDGHQRVDLARFTAQAGHRRAHGGEVDHGWN